MTILASGAGAAKAQTAYQTVTFRVNPISEIAVSGSPAPIVIDAPRGAAETRAQMPGTSYAITTNEGHQKITVALDRAMPAGVALAVSLGAPSGATSRGSVPLGTQAVDAVTAIPVGSGRALPIVYTLSATSAARQGAAGTRLVTYTVTAGL